MTIQIYLDSANLSEIERFSQDDLVCGFTTNPTLMRKAGVISASNFARDAVKLAGKKPISFEVSSEIPKEIIRQANQIASFGENTYVKVPIVNSKGESLIYEIRNLLEAGIKINITAVFGIHQIKDLLNKHPLSTQFIISCFAGRIADTQRDPVPIMREMSKAIYSTEAKLLWASAREVLNVYHAEQAGADIITLTQELLTKLTIKNKDLDIYSQETSQMFFNDALESNLHF